MPTPHIGRPRLVAPVGERFGHLTVLGEAGVRKDGHSLWQCQCRCGQVVLAVANRMKLGKTQSCGCLKTKHGLWLTPEYKTWMGMRGRCQNHPRYKRRGITVCAQWDDFSTFLRDVGTRPSPVHTLDRIDNAGNYEPGNVRWATRIQQMRNTSSNRHITYRGETLTLAEWAERIGIASNNMSRRLAMWPIDKALTLPRFARGRSLLKTGPKPQ